MNMAKGVVLVTGSSGLIGKAVSNKLSSRYRVIGFDRAGPPYPPPVAECIDIDLGSSEGVNNALSKVKEKYGNKIASVLHLAAYYDFSGADSPMYDQITVDGTRRLLNGLKSFEVEQFVFSSTMLVHKPSQPGKLINEDSPLEAKWPYPQSKIKTEELIKKMHEDIPIVLARIAGVYDDFCHSIPISRQIQRIYEGKMTSYVFPGDKSHGQSFIHLEDVVDALVKMVEKRKSLPLEAVFLLGEEVTMGYDDIQNTINKLLRDEKGSVIRIPKIVAKAGAGIQRMIPGMDPFIKPWMIDLADDHYEIDIRRARKFLNWGPKHSLRAELEKMVKALKSNPLQWYQEHGLSTDAIEKRDMATSSS